MCSCEFVIKFVKMFHEVFISELHNLKIMMKIANGNDYEIRRLVLFKNAINAQLNRTFS